MSDPFAVVVGLVLQRNWDIVVVECDEERSFADWFIHELNYWRGEYLRVTSINGEFVGLRDSKGNELEMLHEDINAGTFIPD